MSNFQAPPTYADVVLVDERTKKAKFNPIWLKWFVDLVGVVNASGGGSGSVVHNDTTGKQGGGGTEFYHLIASVYNAVSAVSGALTLLGLTISSGRVQQAQGAAVASANSLTLGTDGNYFQITGATQINLLDSTSWQGGSEVTLLFVSNPLVKHNQVASGAFKPIFLQGAADFTTAAKNSLTLKYDSTDSTWYEQSRRT